MDVASEDIISFTSFFEVECFIFCFLVLLFFCLTKREKIFLPYYSFLPESPIQPTLEGIIQEIEEMSFLSVQDQDNLGKLRQILNMLRLVVLFCLISLFVFLTVGLLNYSRLLDVMTFFNTHTINQSNLAALAMLMVVSYTYFITIGERGLMRFMNDRYKNYAQTFSNIEI